VWKPMFIYITIAYWLAGYMLFSIMPDKQLSLSNLYVF